jgi:predicted transcriptional regulator
MPIVGGFPSLYAEVVWSEPFRHSRLWASLAELCAIDILSAVRSVKCEVLRLAVDCYVLEIPPLDSMDK